MLLVKDFVTKFCFDIMRRKLAMDKRFNQNKSQPNMKVTLYFIFNALSCFAFFIHINVYGRDYVATILLFEAENMGQKCFEFVVLGMDNNGFIQIISVDCVLRPAKIHRLDRRK